MVEHGVDVHGLLAQRPLVAEDLHAVHEIADAAGFVDDELGQRPVFFGRTRFEQLGRAPDAGQRVFDLMRHHRGHGGDGARGSPVRQLPLDHVSHAALLQHQHHQIALLR